MLVPARPGSPSPSPESPGLAAPREREVLVFAAASLSDAFKALGTAFESANPDTSVRFSFAGSQQLAAQILQGAPADVFASADQRQLQAVAGAQAVAGEAPLFAANELTIVVERGNPLRVRGLADLARDLTLVLAAEEVPAGRYARQVLEHAGVQVTPASLENDVRAVLYKVRLGEADAGIVYTSDVVAAGGAVDAISIEAQHNVRAHYPIAVLADAPNSDGGHAFVTFVRSPEGQARLGEYGFSSP
ncbi:MAG: molybdate ABC transporter substrate-binding protein [Actinomycetota bacterium]|nr:molybdate ABC transporter substrate-binding protein [Actinomycetota bacterium]